MNEDRHALIIKGRALTPPPELHVINFHSPKVSTFKGRSREEVVVSEVVVHESVTRSVSATVSVLKNRGLGVHLMVAPNGDVTQHGDLADQRLAHGAPHNKRSVAIEVVNPYKPSLLKPGAPWVRVLTDAPWAHRGAYVVPTPDQAEAVALLLSWLTSPCAKGLSIPRHWMGLREGFFILGEVPGALNPRPGLYAHHYFAHQDAAWLLLYAWLRLEARLPPGLAYDEAILRATGVMHRVDVRDLLSFRIEEEP